MVIRPNALLRHPRGLRTEEYSVPTPPPTAFVRFDAWQKGVPTAEAIQARSGSVK